MSLTQPFEGIATQALEDSGSQNPAGVDRRVWHLHGKTGENEPVREIPLRSFPFTVGRQGDVSLMLHYATVSGTHATILCDNGVLILHDSNSTNGTFVNGSQLVGPMVLRQGDLVQFADVGFRVGRENLECKTTVSLGKTGAINSRVNIHELLNGLCITPHFQPVIRYENDTVVGYEALARSSKEGLESPAAMFRIAEQVNSESELSRVLRHRALETGGEIASGLELFVNTHPCETTDTRFLSSLERLRTNFPHQAITIEVHELTAEDSAAMKRLRDQLDRLDMRLAYDDFGAGKARLLELIEVRPDYLKFDRSLLKNIHVANVPHRETVRSLINIAKQLGVVTIAEGIELEDEARVCRSLGFDLGQGYYHGRPAAPEEWL